MKSKHASFIALAILAVLAPGCENPAIVVKSETVATVDGDKIGEAELNLALSGLGALSEAQATEARIRLLQALVDQRLVAQAAKESGLDKMAEVAIAMEQASRQTLVEAYAERSFRDVEKPSETEVSEYYNQHPELFSQRRIYRTQELELTFEPSRLPEVDARLKSSHSMGDFVNWVREQGIEGKTTVVVKPAEQIPAPLLDSLSQMTDGEVTILPGRPGRVLIQQLQESQLQPVLLEQARNAIEQALALRKRKGMMEADLKKLREAARIEYASGYAPAGEANAADKPVN